VFHCVPRSGVHAVSLGSKVLLGPASSTVIAVVRADGTLASNALISSEALALTGGSIANTFVGALNPGVEIVVVHNTTNPGEVLGACAERAVRTSVLGLAVNALEASAVVVELTGSMSRALVLAHTSLAVATLIPGDLSPRLLDVRRSRGGN
jgi:hypothetical protein